jgi:hypothetical protein
LSLFDFFDAGPIPTEFVAVTVKVYVFSTISPFTVTGLDVPDPVAPPGLAVTVYEVMGLPPAEAGALKLTVAVSLAPFAFTPVGAPGSVAGVTLLDAVDAGPVPTAFVALTVKV